MKKLVLLGMFLGIVGLLAVPVNASHWVIDEADPGICIIGVDSPCSDRWESAYDTSNDTQTDTNSTVNSSDTGNTTVNVTEEAYNQPAPTQGDPYFEAMADDGRWISYVNPRDYYRDPDLGEGSGKLCVTLLNEAGEPIVGESMPDTQVTVPTGSNLDWHPSAGPMTVNLPLTAYYDRPLDSDQFGTSPDLPQGDGIMDAHCLEFHGMPEDAAITYGEAAVSGTNADELEVVGYYDKRSTWNSSIDPLTAPQPYGNSTVSDGIVQMTPDESHADVAIVLQKTGDSNGTTTTPSSPHNETADTGTTPPEHPEPNCHYHYTQGGDLTEHCE